MLNNVNNNEKQLSMMQQISKKRAEQQEKIATGKQINSASDNPAGLAISEALWAEIDGLDAATRNTYDGINMLNTAEGGMGVIQDNLQRVRELTVQAGNGAYSEIEKNIIGNEIKQLLGGINDIAKNTEFNGKALLDGSQDKGNGKLGLELSFQTGANSKDLTNTSISNMSTESLGLGNIQDLDFSSITSEGLGSLLNSVDNAIESISDNRSDIGATQNGLESIINSNNTTSINLQDSVSKITDTDMAKATMQLATTQALGNVQLALQSHQMQDSQVAMKLLFE